MASAGYTVVTVALDSASASNGGSPVTGYNVYWGTSPGGDGVSLVEHRDWH